VIPGVEEGERFGTTVTFLSARGESFAVGGPGFQDGRGAIRVYELDNGNDNDNDDSDSDYYQLGEDLVGEEDEELGRSITGGRTPMNVTCILLGTATGLIKRRDYDQEKNTWEALFDDVVTTFTSVSSLDSHYQVDTFIAGFSESDAVAIYSVG
jgi:hypothetical protein